MAAVAVSELALAELVPVKWDAGGKFQHETAIAAGKFVEICEKLPRGAKVQWRFEAQSPVDFNVHFHEGKEVRFPAKHDQVTMAEGTLDATLAHDYCWMWTNKGAAPSKLKVQLTQPASPAKS